MQRSATSHCVSRPSQVSMEMCVSIRTKRNVDMVPDRILPAEQRRPKGIAMTNRPNSSCAAPIHPNSPFHVVIVVCCVFLFSYLAARLGGALVLRPEMIWPLWPGCAFLVAVLLLTGRPRYAFGPLVLGDLSGTHAIACSIFDPARSLETPNDWRVSSCVLLDLSSRHRTLPGDDDKVFR
jgi:hypothetical protein